MEWSRPSRWVRRACLSLLDSTPPLILLAVGLMIRYRGASNSQVELAIVQVIRGVGTGCLWPPTAVRSRDSAHHSPSLRLMVPLFSHQAAVQTVTKHEHVSVVIACYYLICGPLFPFLAALLLQLIAFLPLTAVEQTTSPAASEAPSRAESGRTKSLASWPSTGWTRAWPPRPMPTPSPSLPSTRWAPPSASPSLERTTRRR